MNLKFKSILSFASPLSPGVLATFPAFPSLSNAISIASTMLVSPISVNYASTICTAMWASHFLFFILEL